MTIRRECAVSKLLKYSCHRVIFMEGWKMSGSMVSDSWVDGWIEGRIDGWMMDGGLNRWMDRWIDRWMDERMDG